MSSTLDIVSILTTIGTAAAVIGLMYTFLRNFKSDIKADMEKSIGKLEKRMDRFESKITSIEERMFWMATGKKLEDAILEERMKNPKTDP